LRESLRRSARRDDALDRAGRTGAARDAVRRPRSGAARIHATAARRHDRHDDRAGVAVESQEQRHMKIGIFGIGSGICADPGVAARVAQAAERAGLESLWTGEHVVLPDPQKAPSPAPPLFPMLHPSTVLAYVAAVTTRVKLGTGIVLIAQRNPVVLAKEMASLDVLSGGRLILGIGAGYLEPEFRALGVPFVARGARTDEYIAAMRVLWTADKPSFDGRFVKFAGIQSRPQPAQRGGPPIVVGGASDAAIERAVASAQGWYGF